MSEEAKKAVEDICQMVAEGKVLRQAIEIAVDLHNASAVEQAVKEAEANAENKAGQ